MNGVSSALIRRSNRYGKRRVRVTHRHDDTQLLRQSCCLRSSLKLRRHCEKLDESARSLDPAGEQVCVGLYHIGGLVRPALLDIEEWPFEMNSQGPGSVELRANQRRKAVDRSPKLIDGRRNGRRQKRRRSVSGQCF